MNRSMSQESTPRTEGTRSTYYGPFFWIAAISFIVPLVVAARAFREVPLATKPTPHPNAAGVDHALWDDLLKTYVASGLVDYDGMGRDYLLRTYLRQLSAAEPKKLTTTADQLALLINAYNAFVVDGVIAHKIRDSVQDFQFDGKGFFDVDEHIFCGQTVSLNQIEHELIRKRFKDPRVHMALVCAAESCPAIRREAYVGRQLAQQLDDQCRLFANSPKYVAYDASQSRLQLSPILKWYGSDWEQQGGYLPWLAARVEDPELKAAITRAAQGQLAVEFATYDWSLNTQNPQTGGAAASPSQGQTDFGSGSIPNQ
jgi:hypothetical protein